MSSPTQKWRQNNPDKVKEIRQRYYEKNRELILEKARQWRKDSPNRKKPSTEVVRNRHYKHKYGISLEEYQQMFSEQGGLCAICSRPERVTKRDGSTASLSIDHCHVTGKVRGLLCRNCNTALGKLDDSEKLLRSAISYLNGDKNNGT